MSRRETSDQGKQQKDQKGIKDLPAIAIHHHRKFGLPEPQDPRRLLLFIAVDPEVDPGSEPIQILSDLTMRVKSLRIAQIVDQLRELTGHLIGIIGRLILILFPLINIFFNKEAFSHWKKLNLPE